MTKAIVRMGYDKYVMDAEDALAIHEILAKAEHYSSKYQSKDDGGTLHYVYPQDATDEMRSFELMPDALYRMAKLAGKPDNK